MSDIHANRANLPQRQPDSSREYERYRLCSRATCRDVWFIHSPCLDGRDDEKGATISSKTHEGRYQKTNPSFDTDHTPHAWVCWVCRPSAPFLRVRHSD